MNKKIVMSLLIIVLIMTGCTKAPELENGEQVIAELKESNITADDLYERIKERYARDVLIDMIDSIILDEKYETDDEMNTYVDTQVEYVKNQSGDEFLAAIKYYYGANNEEDFRNMLLLEAKRAQAIEDFAKSLVTEDEIEEYYEDEVVGDIRASHILIKPEITEDMTEEEKKEEQDKAYALAEEIIEKLDNGEDFAELAREYSVDTSNAESGGDLNFFNKGDMTKNFEESAYSLEVDEYSKEPVETEFGYHIILKTDEKDKPEIDVVRSKVIEDLAQAKLEEDTKLRTEALVELRKESDLKIHDSIVDEQYDKYIDDLLKAEEKAAQ